MSDAQRTPSETLIKALEMFGRSEPKYLIAAWINEDDEVCIARSETTNLILQIGLLESAKVMLAKGIGR